MPLGRLKMKKLNDFTMTYYTKLNLVDAINALTCAIISETEHPDHNEELVKKLRGVKRFLSSIYPEDHEINYPI